MVQAFAPCYYGLLLNTTLLQVEALYQEHAAMLREQRYLTEAKESIAAHIAWLQRNSGAVCTWLEMRGV